MGKRRGSAFRDVGVEYLAWQAGYEGGTYRQFVAVALCSPTARQAPLGPPGHYPVLHFSSPQAKAGGHLSKGKSERKIQQQREWVGVRRNFFFFFIYV